MPELIPAEPLTPGWHAARRAGVTATDIVTYPCCRHCFHDLDFIHKEPCRALDFTGEECPDA